MNPTENSLTCVLQIVVNFIIKLFAIYRCSSSTCLRNILKRLKHLVTARKRSFGQGNIFRSVCQEFCPQGGSTWAGTPPRTRYTPPDQVHSPKPGTPPRTRYTPQTRYSPQTRYTSPGPDTSPRDQVHPLGPGTAP